jgi:hypothetical protein
MVERQTTRLAFDEGELNTLWHALYRACREAEDEACRLADEGLTSEANAKDNEAHRLRSLRLRVTGALNVLSEKEPA